MKKFLLTLVALLVMSVSVNAMSYEQAREQALFLTDKMAYELNLTDEQYEAAYEINLDYLLSIDDRSMLYGTYWQQRNQDLSYILLDWQYRSYVAANYFYRPLYWDDGYWRFGVYARYPRRDYFYFGRPSFVSVYRGGHSWRVNGGRSWYYGRTFVRTAPNNVYFGMRDGFHNRNYDQRSYRYDQRTYRYDNYDQRRSYGGGFRFNNVPMNSRRDDYGYRGSDFQQQKGYRFDSRNEQYDGFQTQQQMNDYQQVKGFGQRSAGVFGNRPSSTRITVMQGPNDDERNNRRFSSPENSRWSRPNIPNDVRVQQQPMMRENAAMQQNPMNAPRSGGSFGSHANSRGSFGVRR